MRRAILAVMIGTAALTAGCDKKDGPGASASATPSAKDKPKTEPTASGASVNSAKPATSASSTAPAQGKKGSLADVQKDNGKAEISAFATHDLSKLMALYADDVTSHVQGQTMKGKAEIEKRWKESYDQSSDIKLGISRLFWHGKESVSEWVMSGKHDKDTASAKATNKPFGFKGATFHAYNDEGLITEEWIYFDTMTMAMQVGMGEKVGLPATMPAPAVPAMPAAVETHLAKEGEGAKNIEAVDKMVAAANAHKEDDVLALWADDGSMWMNAMGGMEAKKKEIKGHDEAWNKTFPDGAVTVASKFATDGDFVIARGTWQGTFKAPLHMGPKELAPTGKPVTMNGLVVYQFKDGKVSHEWAYRDGLELAMQVGMIPGAAPGAASAHPADSAHPAPADSAHPPAHH